MEISNANGWVLLFTTYQEGQKSLQIRLRCYLVAKSGTTLS